MRHSWPLVGCGVGRGMYGVEPYAAVRLAVVEEGLSHREAGQRFGIDRRTAKKMLRYSAPPSYRRTKRGQAAEAGRVHRHHRCDLRGGRRSGSSAQAATHGAHRIFERLRDKHGLSGGYTIVKDYVRARRQTTHEAFVPLHHPPGHAQVGAGKLAGRYWTCPDVGSPDPRILRLVCLRAGLPVLRRWLDQFRNRTVLVLAPARDATLGLVMLPSSRQGTDHRSKTKQD